MELPHDITSCHALILQQAGQIAFLTHQNSELAGQLSALMDQFQALGDQNTELLKQNTELLRQNTELSTQVGVLHKRLEEQESRLNQNSRNSHRPPSSDGPAKRPALPRKAKGKKGGQYGHKGTTLKMSETPDTVVELCPSVCACGADLGGTSQGVIERRQVFDLPPQQLVVTEYRQMHGRCACCKQYWYGAFPKGVGAPVQYGPRVRALSVLLSTEYRTPLRKVGQLFKDLYGQVVNVATISGFLEDCHRRLEPVEEYIRTQLRQGAVVHFDETGIRCAGSLQWLHVASNALFTLLFVHPKRGLEAIGSSTSALVGFKGWAVHDCWASYLKTGVDRHGICMAHIVRELVGLMEQGSLWAPHMRRLLLTLYTWTDKGQGCLGAARMVNVERLYDSILSYADGLEPPPQVNAKGRAKSSKGRNLLKRLTKLKTSVLAFARHAEVPFTNNQAERDLRPAKVKLKVAGTFRHSPGANEYARIQSFISTTQKHKFDVFTQLVAVFQGQKTLIVS